MLTSLTGTIEFWIAFCSILITIGAYWLLTKQNNEQIKDLGKKFESIRVDIKMDQVKMQGSFEHMNDKIQSNFSHMNDKLNRIETDNTATRAHGSVLSEAIARMQERLQNLEREWRGREHENS